MTKTRDRKCFDLAEHFLQDVPHLWTGPRTTDLAERIQSCIEDYIATEQEDHDGGVPAAHEN